MTHCVSCYDLGYFFFFSTNYLIIRKGGQVYRDYSVEEFRNRILPTALTTFPPLYFNSPAFSPQHVQKWSAERFSAGSKKRLLAHQSTMTNQRLSVTLVIFATGTEKTTIRYPASTDFAKQGDRYNFNRVNGLLNYLVQQENVDVSAVQSYGS